MKEKVTLMDRVASRVGPLVWTGTFGTVGGLCEAYAFNHPELNNARLPLAVISAVVLGLSLLGLPKIANPNFGEEPRV